MSEMNVAIGQASSDSPANGSPARTSDSLWLYALLSLLATAGFFYVNIMSAIVDGLITGRGFTTAEAGMVASANVYGASIGALVAVFIVRRISWRPTLIGLLCVLLLIDLASTVILTPLLLTATRAVHGLVGGLAVGITYSVMARTRSPDRAFGMLLFVQCALGGLGVMYLPSLVPAYGTKVLFLAMAGLTSAALLGTFAIPRTTANDNGQAHVFAPLDPGRRFTVGLTLLAMFLFQAGNMALAAFIFGLGENFKLSLDFISSAAGWATWIGASGAVLVIVMGTRFGRVRPILAGSLLSILGTLVFFWSGDRLVFFLANVVTAIVWSFTIPYLFGMCSRLDGSGRVAAMGGFASKLGLASGPLAAGFLLRTWSFQTLIGMSAGLLALSSVAALVAARRVDALTQD